VTLSVLESKCGYLLSSLDAPTVECAITTEWSSSRLISSGPQLQIHSVYRLDGDDSPRDYITLLHIQGPLKFAHECCQQASQFCLGKSLPDAGPWSMQKCHVGIVARDSARVVRSSIVSDPSLRSKLGGISAPDLCVPIHQPRRDHNLGALMDGKTVNGGVASSFPDSHGNGGVQSESLVEHSIQVWQVLEDG
jgi:hypothetical protein